MKLKANIMQILVAELHPNQMGAFYLMRLGVEMPDSVSKTDLTHIITFLCKKLCWIEEEVGVISKSDKKTIEENLNRREVSTSNITVDKGPEKSNHMDWIEDTLSAPIGESSLVREESFESASPQTFGDVSGTSSSQIGDNENQTERISNDKIPDIKSEIEQEMDNVVEAEEESSQEKSEGVEKVVTEAFKCTYCDKTFVDAFGLKRHTRIHTRIDTSGSLCCPQCGKNFTARKHLVHHIRYVHVNDRPFQCSYCGKGFKEQSKVRTHEMIHTGEKPFSCSKCEYRCNNKNSLKVHDRFHTGEFPFSCSKCDKKFALKSSLNTHELTHDGAKPFSCNLCDKKYACKRGLKKHTNVHHKSG